MEILYFENKKNLNFFIYWNLELLIFLFLISVKNMTLYKNKIEIKSLIGYIVQYYKNFIFILWNLKYNLIVS